MQKLAGFRSIHWMGTEGEDLLDFESNVEEKFEKSRLGYTEVPGNPELREEIAKLYDLRKK